MINILTCVYCSHISLCTVLIFNYDNIVSASRLIVIETNKFCFNWLVRGTTLRLINYTLLLRGIFVQYTRVIVLISKPIADIFNAIVKNGIIIERKVKTLIRSAICCKAGARVENLNRRRRRRWWNSIILKIRFFSLYY